MSVYTIICAIMCTSLFFGEVAGMAVNSNSKQDSKIRTRFQSKSLLPELLPPPFYDPLFVNEVVNMEHKNRHEVEEKEAKVTFSDGVPAYARKKGIKRSLNLSTNEELESSGRTGTVHQNDSVDVLQTQKLNASKNPRIIQLF